jgi:2-polyprenyl-6-methoxyphenol hydroxylase-like FAD-dependent oxidoreductase
VFVSPQEGEIFTFFLCHLTRPEHVAREQRLERLRQVFANMGWVTARLLADTPSTTSIFLDAVSQIRMPVWHRGRVTLVGDACDCPTLVPGQGASLAMGGAYLLARALHETGDYREAFPRYEQEMRPHVLTQQKHAHGTAKAFAPISLPGLLARRLLLKLFLHETFRLLLRRQFGAQSILPSRSV